MGQEQEYGSLDVPNSVSHVHRLAWELGILFMLLQGPNGTQHVGHIILRQVLTGLPSVALLLSWLPLWLLGRPCLRACCLPFCGLTLQYTFFGGHKCHAMHTPCSQSASQEMSVHVRKDCAVQNGWRVPV